jgi:3-keto-5-aminohexanoate cleavage enzyme
MIGNGNAGVGDAEARFSHIDALASRGLIELSAVDPGSVNFTLVATTSQAKPAGTYVNPQIACPTRAWHCKRSTRP